MSPSKLRANNSKDTKSCQSDNVLVKRHVECEDSIRKSIDGWRKGRKNSVLNHVMQNRNTTTIISSAVLGMKLNTSADQLMEYKPDSSIKTRLRRKSLRLTLTTPSLVRQTHASELRMLMSNPLMGIKNNSFSSITSENKEKLTAIILKRRSKTFATDCRISLNNISSTVVRNNVPKKFNALSSSGMNSQNAKEEADVSRKISKTKMEVESMNDKIKTRKIREMSSRTNITSGNNSLIPKTFDVNKRKELGLASSKENSKPQPMIQENCSCSNEVKQKKNNEKKAVNIIARNIANISKIKPRAALRTRSSSIEICKDAAAKTIIEQDQLFPSVTDQTDQIMEIDKENAENLVPSESTSHSDLPSLFEKESENEISLDERALMKEKRKRRETIYTPNKERNIPFEVPDTIMEEDENEEEDLVQKNSEEKMIDVYTEKMETVQLSSVIHLNSHSSKEFVNMNDTYEKKDADQFSVSLSESKENLDEPLICSTPNSDQNPQSILNRTFELDTPSNLIKPFAICGSEKRGNELNKTFTENDEDVELTAEGALNVVKDLIQMGYPPLDCEVLLGIVCEKFPSTNVTTHYWECVAALEAAKGLINVSMKENKKNSKDRFIDRMVDHLFKLFNMDKTTALNTSRKSLRRSSDNNQIFKSRIIQFVLARKNIKVNDDENYIATPVRRGTRISPRQNTQKCFNSLNEIGLSFIFKPNRALNDLYTS